MGTILLAGIYGVGKSTLGEKLSQETGIPYYSAGDLISEKIGEQYGANKAVSNKIRNQDVLAEIVSELLISREHILLAGYFCIVTQDGQVDLLPESVFYKLGIEKIILLEAPVDIIYMHLAHRDNQCYSLDLLEQLLHTERKSAESISLHLDCPLLIHKMNYNGQDLEALNHFLCL